MQNDMKISMGSYFGWSASQAKKFEMEGENFDCDDLDYPGTKYAGGPKAGYPNNGHLKNQPCVTKLFCDHTSDIGFCNDASWHCDDFDPVLRGAPDDSKNIDFAWKGPAFNYDKAHPALPPDNRINILEYLN